MALADPADVQVLARSPIPAAEVQTDLPVVGGDAFSEMTYYVDRTRGAGVLDTGTNNWIPALTACPARTPCPAPRIRRMTANILRRFGQGPAGRRSPVAAAAEPASRIRPS